MGRFVIAALVSALWATIAFAAEKHARGDELSCESIQDADQRHFCRAVAKHDKLECELIKNHDLRYECRARAGQ